MISNALPNVTIIFFKKMCNNIFKKKMMVTRGNAIEK